MFSIETAKEIVILALESEQSFHGLTCAAFPLGMDVAWQLIGYSSKQDAIKDFTSHRFIETVDYITINGEVSCLSIECLKDWLLLKNTEEAMFLFKYITSREQVIKSFYLFNTNF